MKQKLVLFDIDGTILLTAGAGRRAITVALAEAVGGSDAFAHVRFDGKTDPQIVGELLTAAGHEAPHEESRVQAVCERYVALLERELQEPTTVTTVMPGVHALLSRLETDHRVVLGLLTGNIMEGAMLKLRAAGIDPSRFLVGAFGSDAGHRPQLPPIAAERAGVHFGRIPSGHDVVIIGDTPADIACGGSIGARAIGVATGAYSTDQLAACGAYAVFADLSDTDRVLAAMLG
ncbi:MAG: HAD hydrolase-like protein [Gemmatimonadota bacterium]